jgi:hypothetical protein
MSLEHQPTPEQPQSTPEEKLLNYAQSIGFVETEEIKEQRQSAIETKDEALRPLFLSEWKTLSEEEVDKHMDNPELHRKAQVGLQVATAAVWFSLKKVPDYHEAIYDAVELADNMNFPEIRDQIKELRREIFKKEYSDGLEDFMLYLDEVPGETFPPDPNALGFDDRTFEQLTQEELNLIKDILYTKFGLDKEKDQVKIRDYVSESDETALSPGKRNVDVYKTDKKNAAGDDIFLQEITDPEGNVRWVVGPDKEI